MTEDHKNRQSGESSGEIDKLALEALDEVFPEWGRRMGEIIDSSETNDERDQRMQELLDEMNIRINQIYQRKKKEASENNQS
jgi:predicted secreted protein